MRGWGRPIHTGRVCSCCRALLSWTPWHAELPACCYSEEVNEAALGRLGHAMRRHPDATTVEDVMDLWLRTRPGRRGYRNIRPGGVDQRWLTMAQNHVDALLERCDPSGAPATGQGGGAPRPESLGDVVTYVSLGGRSGPDSGRAEREEPTDADDESERPGRVEGAWPEDWRAPPVPTAAVADRLQPVLVSVLQKSLRTLMRDSPAAPAVVVEMDALCTRRSDKVTAKYQDAWDAVGGRRPIQRPPTGVAGTGMTASRETHVPPVSSMPSPMHSGSRCRDWWNASERITVFVKNRIPLLLRTRAIHM